VSGLRHWNNRQLLRGALIESKVDLQSLALVSGIGCTGRVAGCVKLDSFHTTHGRAIPFAAGLKLANPRLNVVVYSGDRDLSAIGGNHLIHAAGRNIDLKVICQEPDLYDGGLFYCCYRVAGP
jgi:2-oxoglutarate/2-oxoacid ferredoxin oxidoreductase subunit beta